jgi:ribosomal protein L37AE/L43A
MRADRSKRDARRGATTRGRRTWWQRLKSLVRGEPPAPPPDPLAENPNPQLRPRINLPYLAGHGDEAEDRYGAFSRNVDRRHLRLVGAEEDDSRKCTSCGKSERKARWMITGLSALLCDECVKARIRKALGRSPRT